MRERNESYAPWNQEPEPCTICRRDPAECVCPECPACGATGDLLCYDDEGNLVGCEVKP